MSFTSWLRGLKALAQHTFRKQGDTRSNRTRRPASSRLLLEPLEDRLVPASLVSLASFDGNIEGAYPTPYLVEANDNSGNLFGTTFTGGTSGDGTVFQMAPDGTIKVLADFTDGNISIGEVLFDPGAGLVEDSGGNLFGTTFFGGTGGEGAVFEVAKDTGMTTTLGSCTDDNGFFPAAGLLLDNGNLFGTAAFGGPVPSPGESGYGTVFEVPASGGTIKALAPFHGYDGEHPIGGLVKDSNGDLFGTTLGGGTSGDGTVFELQPDGTLTDLADFHGYDGANPVSGLVEDSSGNLFGTTARGGTAGAGAAFELKKDITGTWTLTTLVSFDGIDNGFPNAVGGLVEDSNGDLFGTTEGGGTSDEGTVYELARDNSSMTGYTFSTLLSFNGDNGAYPDATLVQDSSGNLFGTTSAGGTGNNGTVFEVISHDGLQGALDGQPPTDPGTGDPTVTLQASTQAQADAYMALFDPSTPGFTPLAPPSGATTPTDIAITLGPGISVNEAALVIPQGIRVQINGGAWYGGSPALTLSSGDLSITGATFVNATDAPTILVTGGSLTLRNDTIQESTGFNDPAISITGGTVDLGTSGNPGGTVINVNGTGTFIRNTTANRVSAVGDTFEINRQETAWPIALTVTTGSSLVLVGNSPPPLSGTVDGTPFTGSITYTTPFGDPVTVTLGTTATAASPVDQYAITATLSGADAGNYVINPATSTTGTMYVVSLGADPDGSGAQTVTFWDSKRNASTITAADLSSLDHLNLVTQGGSAFDPHSVAQLQEWMSVSPNATAAYQLAVQLAAMDLNVLAGDVRATDLVFAGGLLPYASADQIMGLTSGGFIDVQDLMNAANAALAQVRPGAPANDPNATYELALATILQNANANTDFVLQELQWTLLAL
jgi:uncharacterized repeat protein (TIGR03803 family)